MNLGTVLITGGTGTFGNAFVERVLADNLADTVRVLSRDEKKQQDMEARFRDRRLRFFLGDVCDRERLVRAFDGADVVIHAAALKQLPRSFLDFQDFKRVNVDGTENACFAAHSAGVKRLIFLSSDKACSSVSPYGSTKSVAEWTTISSNILGSCRMSVTRYGNVENSRGSVLEIWRRQSESGQPLTVTDERMSRFWMTIEEAVGLVLTALEKGRGGEIFIPARIKNSKVIDLLRKHYLGAGYKIIGKTGYEKFTEELLCAEESDRARFFGSYFVLLPPAKYVRWEPPPLGMLEGEGIPVPIGFSLRSDE